MRGTKTNKVNDAINLVGNYTEREQKLCEELAERKRNTKYFFFLWQVSVLLLFKKITKHIFPQLKYLLCSPDLKTLPEMLLLSGNTQTRCSRNTGNTQNIVIKYKVNLALSIKRL